MYKDIEAYYKKLEADIKNDIKKDRRYKKLFLISLLVILITFFLFKANL